jgi:hypothetical protein
MTLDWLGFVVVNLLVVGAYFIGKDAGISDERHRNDRRRAHRLQTNNKGEQQ